ncbi:hypothetical protein Franean1_2786 [Parafrankia sp. EAN1pec]|nr:hypothetical protein Franean1_2786 [Frankia sp. EAN1pec]
MWLGSPICSLPVRPTVTFWGVPLDFLRMLGRDGHPTPLGQAFAEYGRIAKTLALLAIMEPLDDTHRRAVR